ncbi:MAG: response regulator [Candidatus Fermentibacteraceae bacterium]|nr:response regulator [Candidatus Fermentibacteraceae bacterium]
MKKSETRSVLVVEDDHLVSEMIRGMLAELGYTVAGEAEDGHDALEKVRELRPDVVLMDIKMPRMSGIQAALLIQKHFPTPVVILSAYETEELVSDAVRAGVGAYVVKPPQPEELSRAIEVAVGRFGDMLRIRELEHELEGLRRKMARTAGLLPVCPRCGKRRSGDEYDRILKTYFSELSEDEMEVHLCGRCRDARGGN